MENCNARVQASGKALTSPPLSKLHVDTSLQEKKCAFLTAPARLVGMIISTVMTKIIGIYDHWNFLLQICDSSVLSMI